MGAPEQQEGWNYIIVLRYISNLVTTCRNTLTNQITRTPSIALGTAHRIRHVHEYEVAYIEARGVCDLLIVQDLPKDIFTPGAQLNFDKRECVQPASVIRIPRKHLHQLPGDISLRMTDRSLEAVLKRVDDIACAMCDPLKG